MIPYQINMTVAETQNRCDITVATTTHSYELSLSAPFVVAPIPHNYGLITYNGSIITVS